MYKNVDWVHTKIRKQISEDIRFVDCFPNIDNLFFQFGKLSCLIVKVESYSL